MRTHCLLLAFAGLFFTTNLIFAQPPQKDHVSAQLLAAVRSIQPGQPFDVALHLKIDDHWHVYWRNPGDSGLQTSIDWKLPEGFEAGDIQWPYPQRIPLGDLMNFGYEGEVMLITEITPPASLPSGKPVPLEADAYWLVCKEACLPGEDTLTLELAVKSAPPAENEAWSKRFATARSELPLDSSSWDISASLNDSTFYIFAAPPPDFSGKISQMTFFAYEPDLMHHAAPQPFQMIDGRYRLEVQISELRLEPPKRIGGILVSDSGWQGPGSSRALHIDIPLTDGVW